MAKAPQSVDALLAALDHPMKPELERLRAIVLAADPAIIEHVKWNGPSFCWNGEDRIAANVRGRDAVMLVFHRGVKPKDAADIDTRAGELAEVARRWVRATA